MWILIGILAGSLVTAQFDKREACEGRATILREQHVTQIKCIELAPSRTEATITTQPGQNYCLGWNCTP